ncbi:class I SAM-dependent methyltransferase [Arthrobacter sp. ATA002]|nr:class I SAM-dependent methyltransferase [Arthrobacter sp. ATA002]
MGNSQANPHLIRETGNLAPGTALDAGCGAGTEAIWLATHGWKVTGADIASAALDRAAGRAADAGVADQVQWVQADLSTWEPDAQYDLVTTHYAHPAMPQLDFYDRTASWVAPEAPSSSLATSTAGPVGTITSTEVITGTAGTSTDRPLRPRQPLPTSPHASIPLSGRS